MGLTFAIEMSLNLRYAGHDLAKRDRSTSLRVDINRSIEHINLVLGTINYRSMLFCLSMDSMEVRWD